MQKAELDRDLEHLQTSVLSKAGIFLLRAQSVDLSI
jgi:hypothetical protein